MNVAPATQVPSPFEGLPNKAYMIWILPESKSLEFEHASHARTKRFNLFACFKHIPFAEHVVPRADSHFRSDVPFAVLDVNKWRIRSSYNFVQQLRHDQHIAKLKTLQDTDRSQ